MDRLKRSLLVISVFVISVTLRGQGLRDSVFFNMGIYQGIYSEILEQPIRVEYKVLCPDGNVSRSGMDFYLPRGIRTSDRWDYYKNVWDKGHLAPAADFRCSIDTLYLTFSYLNCALQHQSLNRGQWKELEEFERELARKNSEVYVIVNVIFSTASGKVPTGATVPDAFEKIIFCGGKRYCYFFPNRKLEGSFNSYRVECDI